MPSGACAKTETVMLSAAKHLSPCGGETPSLRSGQVLRCAQSDRGEVSEQSAFRHCENSIPPRRYARITETVMLSAAKHLGPCGGETLRCAQSDRGEVSEQSAFRHCENPIPPRRYARITETVMLSAAKHLSPCGGETPSLRSGQVLRCAQSDRGEVSEQSAFRHCENSIPPRRYARITETVMLSAAKHLSPCGGETPSLRSGQVLRCAQSDRGEVSEQSAFRHCENPMPSGACAKTETVMLSAAKHLGPCGGETPSLRSGQVLRCAQSDRGEVSEQRRSRSPEPQRRGSNLPHGATVRLLRRCSPRNDPQRDFDRALE